MGKNHTTTRSNFFRTYKYPSCRMTHFPQGAAGEQVFFKDGCKAYLMVVKNTHTTSQIPFSGSLSNWMEGFNYNHLRKNKYPFSASLPHYAPVHSFEQTDRSFHWLYSLLKIRLFPPTSPPKWGWLLSGENKLCVISLMWKLLGEENERRNGYQLITLQYPSTSFDLHQLFQRKVRFINKGMGNFLKSFWKRVGKSPSNKHS